MDKLEAFVCHTGSHYARKRNFDLGEGKHHHVSGLSPWIRHRLVLEEGLSQRFQRHKDYHRILKKGLEELGFRFLVDEEYRLPMLNSVYVPEGQDEAYLRKRLLERYNIEVGGGLGDFAGKIWRIGLMGESCSLNHINMLLYALKKLMK